MTSPPISTITESTSKPRRLRTMFWTIVGVFLVAVLTGLLLVYLTVDDWSRDLSINWAETSAQHVDSGLHPPRVAGTLAETRQIVLQAATSLPGWKDATTSSGAENRLAFERTTPWFRFVDDITVELLPDENGTLVTIKSRSRVGKGDLGQNPRNIKELVTAINKTASQD